MRNIIAKVMAIIARMGRWVMKVGARGIEWVHERGTAISESIDEAATAVSETVAAVVAAPGRLLDRLLPSRGSAIVPPAEGAAAAPQEQRNKAAERAHQEAQDVDLALSVRAAARALLRGQEPVQTLTPQVNRWLRSLDGSALTYLAAMQPHQVQALLRGESTAQVSGFNPNYLYAPHPTMSVGSRPEPTPEQVRATINATLSAGARERVAARWGLGQPRDDDAPTLRRASGTRP